MEDRATGDVAAAFLGKIVAIEIDRPMGSRHPEWDFVYPVNYGSVPGVIGGDGEDLDAYVLGVDRPLERFEGRCIAVVHRTNDEDDKLVVVPLDLSLSDARIRELTAFQERFFDSVILREAS
jgi:inorganic pyrophosphatase